MRNNLVMTLYNLNLPWGGKLVPQEMTSALEIKLIFYLIRENKCNRADCMERSNKWISWVK